MDTLTQDIIDELNRDYGNEFVSFSKAGMTLHYRGRIKKFFEDEDNWRMAGINNEMEFGQFYGDFRDHYLGGSGSMEFCSNNDDLYPYHFGMTQAPLFSFGGLLYCQDVDPIRYAFMYFNSYQVKDWSEVLRREGKVIFETFINNAEANDKAYEEASLTD